MCPLVHLDLHDRHGPQVTAYRPIADPIEVSDYNVPAAGVVVFVKSYNIEPKPYGSPVRRIYKAVHIENEHDRPYGGQSLTYCGRTLETGSYQFVRRFMAWWHTCKACHKSAYRRDSAYHEVIDYLKPEQLKLPT
jgi:hypothetical protein